MIPDHEAVSRQIPAIGRLIEDEGERRGWIALISRLHALASPGGPLDGWVFHGTETGRAIDIAEEGIRRTHASVNGTGRARRRWRWTTGVHVGTPAVAAFYAEDLIESTGVQIGMAVVAIRLDELAACGPLRADGQSVDCPLVSRIGLDGDGLEAAQARWDASDMDWRASMAFLGSLVCLGRVPAHRLRVVHGMADAEALAAEAARRPACARAA